LVKGAVGTGSQRPMLDAYTRFELAWRVGVEVQSIPEALGEPAIKIVGVAPDEAEHLEVVLRAGERLLDEVTRCMLSLQRDLRVIRHRAPR
jgi:hypothetical protein